MATYKVIQDVEADDKLIGPLSLKQFIFAGVGAVCIYLSVYALSKGFWPALIIFLPVIFATGLLAFPWRRDQPTEIWLAARIRFILQPRKRIWNQAGLKELVTITVPKLIEKHLTKDFTGEEASGRLNALATVLDSRGWAVKNSNLNLSAQPVTEQSQPDEERLLNASEFTQETPETEITAGDDKFDVDNNVVAQNFEKMIQKSEHQHRQQLQEKIASAREKNFGKDNVEAADAWFAEHGRPEKPEPAYVVGGGGATVAPNSAHLPTAHQNPVPTSAAPSDNDEALLKRIHEGQARASQSGSFAHLKTISPLGEKSRQQTADSRQPATNNSDAEKAAPSSAIMQLAIDNDKNVATLAREAKRDSDQHLPENEVVISLH